MNIEERLTRLEERFKAGFKRIDELFSNHLKTHEKKENKRSTL